MSSEIQQLHVCWRRGCIVLWNLRQWLLSVVKLLAFPEELFKDAWKQLQSIKILFSRPHCCSVSPVRLLYKSRWVRFTLGRKLEQSVMPPIVMNLKALENPWLTGSTPFHLINKTKELYTVVQVEGMDEKRGDFSQTKGSITLIVERPWDPPEPDGAQR